MKIPLPTAYSEIPCEAFILKKEVIYPSASSKIFNQISNHDHQVYVQDIKKNCKRHWCNSTVPGCTDCCTRINRCHLQLYTKPAMHTLERVYTCNSSLFLILTDLFPSKIHRHAPSVQNDRDMTHYTMKVHVIRKHIFCVSVYICESAFGPRLTSRAYIQTPLSKPILYPLFPHV